jgi:hypothetical protein
MKISLIIKRMSTVVGEQSFINLLRLQITHQAMPSHDDTRAQLAKFITKII